ncbi:hypothetical protein LTR62_007906 [Meristemomyces frigidus]|uniref:Glucose-methanol-choline oxidoreductase C-terminal domain-containing protein n=1 Tax=Meristemomyces frigidus TaxID=1508187 RepID=A0AAN7TN15_9PEZI|nr:hypothetical protein LTR62_007906 [Meristemomyces frigidus]
MIWQTTVTYLLTTHTWHDSVNIGGVSHNVSISTIESILAATAGHEAEREKYLANATGVLGNIVSDVIPLEKLPASYRANFTASTNEKLEMWPADWLQVEFVPSASGSPAETNPSGVGDMGILIVAAISRSNVTISSNNMSDAPVAIDPSIISSPKISPGANITSDVELLEVIKTKIGGIHHASATCMMGAANESMAVVDSHGRAFGVEGLTVIDVSSLRFTPPGHTQAATHCQAEKLVADVMNEW